MVRTCVRIAHVVEGFSGGLCTYMCRVLPELVKRGLHVTLVTSLERGAPDMAERIRWLRGQGVNVAFVPMTRRISVIRDARAFWALVRLLSQGRFDIVHTHCSKAGALGRLAAWAAGGIATAHSPHCFAFLRCGTWLHRRVYRLLEKLLAWHTNVLVAVGPGEADVAVRYHIIPPARCVSVCNGVDLDAPAPGVMLPPAAGLPYGGVGSPGTRIVAVVGRLVEYKGVFRLLQAAQLVQSPDCLFLIVGEGELRPRAEAYVRRHGLQQRVRFAGYRADVGTIYRSAEMLVLCSEAEAMPYCLLEAMLTGCPIIATAVPGTMQLLEHRRTGLLVVPHPAAIAAAIDELLGDPEMRRQLALRAYAHVRQHYSLGQQIEQLTKVYESLL